MCAPSRRRCRPASGAASVPTTTCSPSKASWTSWRARPARIRSHFAATCSTRQPRLKAALELAAREVRLGQPLPARTGAASAAQSPSAASSPRWSKPKSTSTARCAAPGDVRGRYRHRGQSGHVVAQLQGGLIFGLTAALYGEITIDNGRVQQTNFNDYRMLRIDEVPQDRGAPDQERRGARRHRRDRHDRRAAGACATRSTRRPASRCGACRSTASAAGGRGRNRHAHARHHARYRRSLLIVVRPALPGSYFGPGPMAFAGGQPVALSDYHAADPTGVPADSPSRHRQARRISRPRRRLRGLPHRARRRAICRRTRLSHCRSGRSSRPTSRPTRRPASATTATRIFLRRAPRGAPDGARLYPAMPYPPTPI